MEMPSKQVRQRSVLYSPVAKALPETLDVASPYLPAAQRASETFGQTVRPQINPSAQKTGSSRAPQSRQ
jgi:membrane protein required for colicin V production